MPQAACTNVVRVIGALGFCGTIAACSIADTTKPHVAAKAPQTQARAFYFGQPGHLPMLDELFEEVDRRAPGFAGMYRSSGRSITIRVAPGVSSAEIEAAVRIVFADFPWSNISEVRFKPAKYSVRTLQAWRVQSPKWGPSGVIWTDFDEVNDVVRVGVDVGTSLSDFADRARAIGVPDDAIVFEHSRWPQSTALITTTHRPTVAGIRIRLSDSVITNYWGAGRFAECSLGANVRLSTDNTHEYFLTAGHCTGNDQGTSGIFGPNHGANVFQPDSVTNPTPIGIEVSNPTGSSGLSGCPAGFTCKYSDAALFQYTSTSLSNFAFIARDSSFSSTLGVPGSLFRVDSFHVVNDIAESYLLAADTVAGQYDTFIHKLGQARGWTWGPVSGTCRELRYNSSSQSLLCQYVALAEIDQGDSGGPTFWWMCCGGPNQAWLGGLAIAGYTNSHLWFSSITGIKNDIANLVTY